MCLIIPRIVIDMDETKLRTIAQLQDLGGARYRYSQSRKSETSWLVSTGLLR